ncbi:hypothetical protein PAEPH01_0987 [Pancytospora epiphaga]|nr:hypothetical protein PAEPH01_0987 [Pancytospora epiphaga]
MYNGHRMKSFITVIILVYFRALFASIPIRMDNIEQVFHTEIKIVESKEVDRINDNKEVPVKIELLFSVKRKIVGGTVALLENKMASTDNWSQKCVLLISLDAEKLTSVGPIYKDFIMLHNMYYCVRITAVGIEENSKVFKFTGTEFITIENIENEKFGMSKLDVFTRRSTAKKKIFSIMILLIGVTILTFFICFFSIKPIQ